MSTKKILFFKIFLRIALDKNKQLAGKRQQAKRTTEFICAYLDGPQCLQQQWLLIDTIQFQGLCYVTDSGLIKHVFGSCFGFIEFNV